MFRKKKYPKRKIFVWLVLLISFFIWVSFVTRKEQNYSKIEKIIRDMGAQIQSILIPKSKEYSENLIEGINQQLEEENQELKQLLELEIEEYQFIHANVIARELDWYQEVTLNKGEKDGVKVDMAVVSNQGLIGKIIKTGYSSSVVKLLTSNAKDMKVAVDVKNGNESIHGIIDAYLEEESLILVNNISKNQEVEIGDKIYTNGLGGIYPAGIYIGKVVEVTYDSLGLQKQVKVSADFSYDTLRYVSIVGRGQVE